MFTHSAALIALLVASGMVVAGEGPQLGEPVTAKQIDDLSYTILPDGDGLPEGSGTAATGEALYEDNCLACHGAAGRDGVNDRLAGGLGTIHSGMPVKTVGSYWPYATTLFDYIRRAMPFQAPGSLTNNELYALTAYVLYLNEIVAIDTKIDSTTLPDIQMPNRDNFIWAVPDN